MPSTCPTIAATSSRCGVGTRTGWRSAATLQGRLINMAWTRAEIHYATGFDNGDLFRSAEEVREYFTVANITEMFGSCPYTQAELNEMADEVIAHRWHMAIPVDEYRTVYTDVFGAQLEAIQLPWSVVRSILGREHRGTAEDDAVLIERLLESGAPEWVRDAEGWVDEHGWGLIGPDVAGEE